MAKRTTSSGRKAGAKKKTTIKRAGKKAGKKVAKKVRKKAAKRVSAGRKTKKKVARKTGARTKAARKVVKKAAKKAGAKRKTARSKSADPMKGLVAARPVKTGRGADPRTIGEDLVLLCNTGRSHEVTAKWLHPRVESIEADGQLWKGVRGVEAKSAWWYANHDVHGFSAEGPYVGATGFSVRFRLAVTPKGGEQDGDDRGRRLHRARWEDRARGIHVRLTGRSRTRFGWMRWRRRITPPCSRRCVASTATTSIRSTSTVS